MNIVLIHPPHVNSTDDRLDPPLGLLYIASNLRKNNIPVQIVDLSNQSKSNWVIPYADYYGITVYITSIQVTQEIIQLCKQINPKCKIIVGGAHPTSCPNDFPYVDHVVIGYGEVATLDILNGKEKDHIIYGKEPDNYFEFPSYDLIDINSYHRKIGNKTSLPYLTSRGCPFHCFPKGVKVIVSNGINKSIEKIEIGDKLIGFDNGKLVETEVKELFKNNSSSLLKITFEDNSYIKCTQDHPFFVKEKWIRAKDLNINDEIYKINFKDKISFQKKLYNPMKDKENRDKVSNTIKIRIKNGEIEPGFKIAWKKHTKEEMHIKYINSVKWKKMCKNISKVMSTKNPMKNKNTSNKVRISLKKKYDSGELIPYFKKVPKELFHMKYVSTKKDWDNWKKRNRTRIKTDNPMHKPHVNNLFKREINGIESFLLKILKENFPDRYEFTGYSNRIGWFYPDYTSTNGEKKLIELYGCYWHKCKECCPDPKNEWWLEHHKRRIKNYEKFGYKVLEIWEHELKEVDSLIKKIGNFTYNGLKIKNIEKIESKQEVYNFRCEPYENYFVSTNKGGNYILSHNCSFCGLEGMHKLLGYGVKFAEAETVINHIKRIKEEFGITSINFQDDIFTLKPTRLIKILDFLKKENITYRCMGRAGFDKKEIYKLLAESGCEIISWGIESGNQIILDRMKKDVTVEDNYNVIQWSKEYGMISRAFFIIGFPGETKETLEDTKNFIIKSDPSQVFVSSFVPYPGTDVYNNPEKYGIINISKDYEQFYQVSKSGLGGMNTDTKWLSKYEFRELEIEFRNWVKEWMNHKERRGLQDYEKELYEIKK